MKANKFLSYLVVFTAAIMISSCVQDDDYEIPSVVVTNVELVPNTTIGLVKSMYTGSLVEFSEASNGGNLIMEGYVISNDEAGNFYKTLILQDAPENPTAGIKIDIDAVSLFSFYKPGRKVYVKLSGLGMTESNGVLQIGTISGTGVERISATNYQDYIVRSEEIATIVPKIITPAQYSDVLINTLIQLEDMQLSGAEVGLPYANAYDTYNVNRSLKNCVDDSYTILRNSGYSSFSKELFPVGKGSISGIFSKYNSDYQLFIRDTEDISFDGDRCDPLFEEYFETNFTTWTAFSVTGSQVWSPNSYGNPGYCAAMSGYSSGSTSENEDWLITPAIDLSAVSSAVLTFQTAKNYTGNVLEVYMCTDYLGGDPNDSGSWVPLSVTLSTGSWSWTDSGNIDVSAAAGENLFVAFKYTCTGSSSATYEVDNVKVFVP
ncbi:MAG: DUF5689 domain-containing protein [Flavobacteriaceae bacterium]|jgi:hypothetical protein|nr:DUF5689 domain-containing protein [Flavobacteriaceae bacterium]MDA7727902.1 DUF5689 domain-containing protein [Flavobacteriaceae bacterium]MDG1308921.1 DUF5689 domain-containing protein [Flavobacteriaceae bacterium]|tara:strand:+ start:4243 stop:5541 length:1299 start_codon:yes stop_codon:yes gene_type:complete